MTRNLIVTGSSGLIGGETALYFDRMGYDVFGIDNNMRRTFFGPSGDTSWNLERIKASTRRFVHRSLDIRDREKVLAFFQEVRPGFVLHCAAQPSHDLATLMPFEDFDVNAVGTLNVLEGTRRANPKAVFVFMSTNKVYGDSPNEIPRMELQTRFDYVQAHQAGIDESCRIDQSRHSLFGASKVAADVLTQEYGMAYDLRTVCLRGGCLTGEGHSGVELHGFLNYLCRVAKSGLPYRIFGYKGKQVRDNIHASDVVSAVHHLFDNPPPPGRVYNIGGGRGNSVSILEAIDIIHGLSGLRIQWEYVEQARAGDHICYITNLDRLQTDYPSWSVSKSLEDIFRAMLHADIAPAAAAGDNRTS